MAQRYIYISEELNQRLKKEENASALISSLLNQHYKTDKFEKMSLDEKEKYLTNLLEVRKAERLLKEKEQILENGN